MLSGRDVTKGEAPIIGLIDEMAEDVFHMRPVCLCKFQESEGEGSLYICN